MCKAWEGFTTGAWQSRIDVRDFIQKNYTPYGGDEAFLAPATPRTQALMHKLQGLMKLEQEFGGVLDVDTQTVSSLLNYKPGYLDKDNELIVGLQTDRPLKRGVNPFGGIRMAREACRAYGYELSGQVEQEFAYRTTHNDGVFRVYNEQTRAARHCGLITGLPDAYGRGRIIGDYRRVALYGTDRLIEEKKKDKAELGRGAMTDENIRLIEEVWRQIDFLGKLRDMAALYGCDIKEVSGAIVSSVVPQLNFMMEKALTRLLGKPPMVVGAGIKTGLNIRMEFNSQQLGADIVASAVAALEKYPVPIIMIDMGTATIISYISEKRSYEGGLMFPGVRVSLDALSHHTAQLPSISLQHPKHLIGKNTEDCMRSGIVYGTAAMLDGIIDRIRDMLDGQEPSIVATGPNAPVIVRYCRNHVAYDKYLLMEGLRIIYEKNADTGKRETS